MPNKIFHPDFIRLRCSIINYKRLLVDMPNYFGCRIWLYDIMTATSVALPHCVVGWSAVCGCGIS